MFLKRFNRIKKDSESYKELKKRLEKKEEYEKAGIKIATLFRNPEIYDESIEKVLKILAEISNSERAYILQLKNSDTQYMSHEYCKIKLLSAKKRCQNLPYKKQPWMIEQYFKLGHVNIPDTNTIPFEGRDMKEIYKKSRIGSILSATILINYNYHGSLCITNRRPIDSWPTELIHLVQFSAALIEHAIERKANIEKLKDAQKKVQEHEHLKSSFLMNLSHEIRTPLNSIVGFSHLLAKKDIEIEKRLYLSKILSENSLQLLKIIENLIDIARIDSESLIFDIHNFNLSTVFDSLISKFEPIINESKSKKLIVDIEQKIKDLTIKSDSQRIIQIISNLLENADKFSDAGSITLSAAIEKDILNIKVIDCGIGIKNEHLDSIFERFWQVDMTTTRKFGGNGLGLAICKEMAEIMGYKILVNSTPELGSTFTLQIPLNHDIEHFDHIVNKNKFDRKKILIMDDFDVIQSYTRQILESKGYNCKFTNNLTYAIESLKEENFDLIILDTDFQGYNGKQMLEYIREKNINTPVIIQTMLNDDIEKEEYLKLGCKAYLEKPHKPHILLENIKRIIKD